MTMTRHSSVYARNLKDAAAEVKKEKMLKINQVTERLNCSKSYIYKMMNEGKLEYITLGEKNGKRVPESDLERFIEDQKAAAGA